MPEVADRRALDPTGPLADRGAWRADGCPAAAALTVVGTRSALLILREALYGTTRFDDFADRVGITETVTATRLRELVTAGVLEKVPYREPGRRTRHEYRLTAAGLELAPVVLGLYEWGSRHLTDDGRGPFTLRHQGCGAEVHVDVVCDDGHRVGVPEVALRRSRR